MSTEIEVLKKQFNREIIKGYESAKRECGYNATRFIQDVSRNGGYAVAKKLIRKSGASDGFTKLWEFRRLDLSVEALVLRPEFYPLFSEEERQICRQRLEQYGYVNKA